jgi:tetratricopeptide (TPR) repeat protein
MIVVGSRMYGRRNQVKGWGLCAHCGTYGKNTSYNGRKWGHLYFIPLIPEGPRVRVVKECKKCSHGVHMPEPEALALLNSLRQGTNRALAALIAGEKTFDDNGTAIPSAAYLAGAVEMLLCLQADEHLHLVTSALQVKGLNQVYHLVNGQSLEFQGKLDEAAEAYQQAAACEPQDPLPLMSLGDIRIRQKDYQSAQQFYEEALSLSEDRFPVLQVLLTIYKSTKNHPRLAETYEECFALVPELANDKAVFKAYKKSCIKAAKQPIAK